MVFAVLFSIALFVTRQNWFLKQPSAKDYQTTTAELTYNYGCGITDTDWLKKITLNPIHEHTMFIPPAHAVHLKR